MVRDLEPISLRDTVDTADWSGPSGQRSKCPLSPLRPLSPLSPLRPLTRVPRASELLWLAHDSWLLVRHGFGQRQFSSLVHYRVFNRLRPGVGGHTLETRRAGCGDSAQY